jgi:pyridoxal phosphate phosphatase PHOSPHO2
MASSAPSPRAAAVVFDFDHSFIQCNSDVWVPEKLSPAALKHLDAHKDRVQWTALMDEVCGVMHADGVSPQAIVSALASMPIDDAMLRLVHWLHEQEVPMYIMSDANTVYIAEFLKHHKIEGHFAAVVTNPSRFERFEGPEAASESSEGATERLRVRRYHEHAHGCARCPINLCKGLVMDDLKLSKASAAADVADAAALALALAAAVAAAPRVAYVGDGGGDLCPSLRLGEGDLVCARAEYPLLARLRSEKVSPLVRAEVVAWHTSAEVGEAIRSFVLKA